MASNPGAVSIPAFWRPVLIFLSSFYWLHWTVSPVPPHLRKAAVEALKSMGWIVTGNFRLTAFLLFSDVLCRSRNKKASLKHVLLPVNYIHDNFPSPVQFMPSIIHFYTALWPDHYNAWNAWNIKHKRFNLYRRMHLGRADILKRNIRRSKITNED